MVTIEIKREYTLSQIQERWPIQSIFRNDFNRAIKQIIFEEMLQGTLPLRITIDNEELSNEQTPVSEE